MAFALAFPLALGSAAGCDGGATEDAELDFIPLGSAGKHRVLSMMPVLVVVGFVSI